MKKLCFALALHLVRTVDYAVPRLTQRRLLPSRRWRRNRGASSLDFEIGAGDLLRVTPLPIGRKLMPVAHQTFRIASPRNRSMLP
jgi:hypothetical protein